MALRYVFFSKCVLYSSGKRGGSVVSASDLGPEGREFEPWPVHPRCVLRQNTHWGQPDKMELSAGTDETLPLPTYVVFYSTVLVS